MSSVKVNMVPGWEGRVLNSLNKGVLSIASDVHNRSKALAPVDTRALVNSAITEPVKDGYKVKYGSSRVPYARRRHFENNKNPQTKGYLAKAAESVVRGNLAKHFKVGL